MTKDVVQQSPSQNLPANWNHRKRELVRKTLGQGLTPDEFALALNMCQHKGLDPISREVHLAKLDGRLVLIDGIDGMVKIAKEKGVLKYFTDPKITIRDKTSGKLEVVEGNLFDKQNHELVAVKAGFVTPEGDLVEDSFYLDECAVTNKAGHMNARWAKAPLFQLVTMARRVMLRRHAPKHFSGIYGPEEVPEESIVDVDWSAVPETTVEPDVTQRTGAAKEVVHKYLAQWANMLCDDQDESSLSEVWTLLTDKFGMDVSDLPDEMAGDVEKYLKSYIKPLLVRDGVIEKEVE